MISTVASKAQVRQRSDTGVVTSKALAVLGRGQAIALSDHGIQVCNITAGRDETIGRAFARFGAGGGLSGASGLIDRVGLHDGQF